MAINLLWHQSTSGLGGARVASEITGALFTAIPSGGNGATGLRNYNKSSLYRCAYLINTGTTTSLNTAAAITQTSSTYFTMDIALAAAGKNGTATSIANETTAPAVTGAWASSLSIGTLLQNEFYPIWIRMTLKDVGSGNNGGWTLTSSGQS